MVRARSESRKPASEEEARGSASTERSLLQHCIISSIIYDFYKTTVGSRCRRRRDSIEGPDKRPFLRNRRINHRLERWGGRGGAGSEGKKIDILQMYKVTSCALRARFRNIQHRKGLKSTFDRSAFQAIRPFRKVRIASALLRMHLFAIARALA